MHDRHPNHRPLNAGEREMLVSLLHSAGPRIAAYVRHTFGDVADADDVVAETFCRAAANMPALLRAERREFYLLTIARNYCRDALRRRTPDAVPGEVLDERPNAARDPREFLAGSEMNEELRRAVANLPETQRELVVLRMSAGLTFQEIADLLSIPLATALSRMHTALHRLRTVLGVRV